MNGLHIDKTHWKEYEDIVFEECKNCIPCDNIQKNVHQKGQYSKRSRQIDIFIEQTIKGRTVKTVIDCKYYNRKVNVKKVESFIGMIDDLNVDRGIIISDMGYTKAALDRAYYNPKHIELDIYSLNDFKGQFQSLAAIPHAGEYGVFLIAPLGYCIDGCKNEFSLCTLYQKGLTFKEATKNFEFAYVNIWVKDNEIQTLTDLNNFQIATMKDQHKIFRYEMISTNLLQKEPVLIRIAEYDNKPFIEITGIIEFKKFLFFVVWFCPENTKKRNLRKLEILLSRIVPINIIQDNEQTTYK